ncbi:hypothetical protein MKX01_015794, partial [Papaver californicum]
APNQPRHGSSTINARLLPWLGSDSIHVDRECILCYWLDVPCCGLCRNIEDSDSC